MTLKTTTADPTLARLFIPICKIDEEQRLVYGKMTFEGVDSAGEIWDYDGSKPYFEKWSENAAKSSSGKSLGNLRSMHQPIAAGKLTQFVLDDETKSVHICGKVVDDGEWGKVLEGVYTGFSQGGRYVKRWKDENDSTKTRYISDPVEVSLVDLPCLPGAEFEYVKADGSVELRKFTTKETPMYEPTNEEVAARATQIAKSAGGKWSDHIETAVTELKAEHASKAAGADAPAGDATAPAAAADASTVLEADASTDANKAKGAADPAGDEAAEEDDGEGNGDGDEENDEGTEEADDAEEKKAKAKKARDSLVQVWLTPEQQALLGKAAFVKAADAVSAIVGEDEPAAAATPASPVSAALAAAKAAAAEPTVDAPFVADPALALGKATLSALCEKGLWTASRALDVLDSVISLQCSSAWEAEAEGDNSPVPAALAEAARQLGAAALAMCSEEIAEALAFMEVDDPNAEVIVDIVAAGASAEFVKGILGNEELMKVGARNARADKDRIQKIHDNSVDLGAECSAEEAADKLAKAAESSPLIKGMLEQNELLKTQVSEAVEGIGDLTKTIGTMREEITALKATPAPMAPRTSIIGKTADADGGGAAVVEKGQAETMISEMMKTESGRTMLADAAIRAAQENGFTR